MSVCYFFVHLQQIRTKFMGTTSNQIQSALFGATNWNAWRDNIKNQHTNSTSGNIDELFNYYQ